MSESGRLLDANHVVVWERVTEGEGDTEKHTVVAQNGVGYIGRGFSGDKRGVRSSVR